MRKYPTCGAKFIRFARMRVHEGSTYVDIVPSKVPLISEIPIDALLREHISSLYIPFKGL